MLKLGQLQYEDLIIQNLLDENINTLSRQMAQYLIESIFNGKNVLITGGNGSGRTLLLNILAKSINMNNSVFTLERRKELILVEHQNYSIDLTYTEPEKKNKDYFIISKSLPFYDEYQTFIMDDVPRSSYTNIYRLLLSNKQVLANFNEKNNFDTINTILKQTLNDYKAHNQAQQIGISLMEKVDILVHIRQYEDDFIRVKEISETSGYNPHNNQILLETVFEYSTNGKRNANGKLIGDFIRY